MNRRLLASALVLALTLTSACALHTLVATALWLPRTVVCLAITALVTAVVRLVRRTIALATIAGLVTGLVALSATFFGEQALLGIVPTSRTLEAVQQLVPQTLAEMRSSYPPVVHSEGIALFVAAGVLVVYLLAELLAVAAWAPAWAGLPMLGLWCVPIMLGAQVHGGVVAAAAALYILVIAVQARDDGRHRRRLQPRGVATTVAMTAATLVLALVVAPALLKIPAPMRWHPFYELVATSSTRLDLGLDLRDDLLRSEEIDLFSYTGADPETVGPWQAYTMTEFTGSAWVRSDDDEQEPAADRMLWPTSLDGVDLGPEITIDLTIDDLGQDRLLIPGEPRFVDAQVETSYVSASDEVLVDAGGELTYTVTMVPRILQDQLADLQPATDVDPSVLELPDTGYASDIGALAQQVVDDAGASNPYEQMLALQNYLRDPSLFTYTTTIDSPTTPDAVWDFLNDRHGYCVQFATAMVMMARSLGVPARLAVGFLPGDQTGGVATVTGHDAHAWPQIQFEEVGWVRFEPTPGVQAGQPPAYAPEPDPEATPTQEPSSDQTATPESTEATPTEEDTDEATQGTGLEQESQGATVWWLVLLGLAAVAVLLAALARRRARLRGPDVGQGWDQLLPHLERLGIDVSPAQTPRAVVHQAGDVLTGAPLTALARLAAAVEAASYQPSDAPRPDGRDIDAWSQEVLRATREVTARGDAAPSVPQDAA